MSKADKAWIAFRNAEAIAWGATGAAWGYALGQHAFAGSTAGYARARVMTSYMTRVHLSGIHATLKTPFYRGASYNLYKAGGSVLAGYVIGAYVGTAIVGAIWGEAGEARAKALYLPQFMGGESFGELDYFGTIQRKLATYS